MENETVTLRSSVLPELMRQTLLRGTVLGVIGALTLLFGGVFIPIQEMKVWGPFLFLFSVAMITLGLLPYKRLKRLEEKPNTITIEGEEWLHFSAKGKPLFKIPIPSIDHISYIDKNHYGIAIFLKDPLPKKLMVQETHFDLAAFYKRSLSQHQCDLFLPYFSQRSFYALQEYLIS